MAPKIPIIDASAAQPIPTNTVFDFVRKYFRNNIAIHKFQVTKITNT